MLHIISTKGLRFYNTCITVCYNYCVRFFDLVVAFLYYYLSDHGVQMKCRCGVTTGRGQSQRHESDVLVHDETGVHERHEQQRPTQAAHQPGQHATSQRTGLAGHFQHVTHQAGAELRQQADDGQHKRAASTQCVVHGQCELDQTRDHVDGAPSRVPSKQAPWRQIAVNMTRSII